MHNINKIIKESINLEINRIINESLSSKIYHFCPIASLVGIVKNDAFLLTKTGAAKTDNVSSVAKGKLYPFYMCFSRTPSTKLGYQRLRLANDSWVKEGSIARISLDGDLLNSNFVGRAASSYTDKNSDKLDKFYDNVIKPNGLNTKENGSNVEVDYRDVARQQRQEYEDRLLSDKPFIKNIDRYITRIDILVLKNTSQQKNIISDLLKSDSPIANKINVYDNESDFERCLKIDTPNINKEFIGFKSNPIDYDMNEKTKVNGFGAALRLITYGEKYTSSDIDKILVKYGLKGNGDNGDVYFINSIYNSFEDYPTDSIENIKTLSNKCIRNVISTFKGPNMKYGTRVIDMINDYCKELGIEKDKLLNYKLALFKLINKEQSLKLTPSERKIYEIASLNKNAFSNFVNNNDALTNDFRELWGLKK